MAKPANLSAQPSQDDIRKVVALYRSGKLPEAERAARRLVRKFPGALDLFDVLSVIQIEQGKIKEAAASCRQVLKADPRRADAHSNLGIALHEMRDSNEAAESFRRALELKPDHADAHNNLGMALQDLGRLEEAVSSYRQALKYNPRLASTHTNLGVALKELGRFEEAAASHRQALQVRPQYAEAHTNLGVALKELGRVDEAIASYRRALEIAPDLTEAHANLGVALMEAGRLEEALASHRRALELTPDSAKAHGNLGLTLQQLGQLEEAIVHFRWAIELQPDYAEVHRYLANARKQTEHDADIKNMERSYERPDCSPQQKMHLGFALGKAFEDLGDYDASFEYLREGNRLKRASLSYSADQTATLFHNIEKVCDKAFLKGANGGGNESDLPVFVVGIPRSGTGVVEQILASHRDVFGAGEIGDFPMLINAELAKRELAYPAGLADLDDADFGRIGAAYLERQRARGGSASRVTDRLSHNFTTIGVIARCLPNARIIHVTRDAMDTCFSIYAELFRHGHAYGYDLTELGHYYRLYEQLMAHWRKLVPDPMLEVSFESLVAEPEAEVRRMLDYCDVPFEPACLEFHNTERPAGAASLAPLGQPLNSSSVGRWRHFGKHLEPLRVALNLETK